MACSCQFSFIPLIVIMLLVVIKVRKYFRIPRVPRLEEVWWGKGHGAAEDNTIEPFKISISHEILADLRQRLERAIPFEEPIEDAKHHYGINSHLLAEIVEFWKTKYDWKEREQFLNQYPQYKLKVQGLNIHYIHVRPEKKEGLKVLPLLLVHGWPGSVREFYEIIPLLTTPRSDRGFVFEVVIPSLPGFGFSDSAVRKGLGTAHTGVIFNNLMNKIGFRKYYIQGGDWGASITEFMSILFPQNIIGVLSNMPLARTPVTFRATVKTVLASFFPSIFLTEEEHMYKEVFNLRKRNTFWYSECGYSHLQDTKPDTVGVGLRDSPVGLAAYILEKFITWTNPNWLDKDDGGLTIKYNYTKLLDNIMLYWVTRSITTSARIYKEHHDQSSNGIELHKIPVTIPSGCARFAHDILCFPESLLREKYRNCVHISFHSDGGHFAAFELPNILANEIFEFVGKVENLKKYNQI